MSIIISIYYLTTEKFNSIYLLFEIDVSLKRMKIAPVFSKTRSLPISDGSRPAMERVLALSEKRKYASGKSQVMMQL